MFRKIVTLICLISFTSCAELEMRSRISLKKIDIGMKKTEVEELIGEATEIKQNKNEFVHVYKRDGYVWYDEKDNLNGFASYNDNPRVSFINIERAIGYKIKETEGKKIFITFEAHPQLNSKEGKLIFLQNKKHIENLLTSKGYKTVSEKGDADIIIFTKIGTSDPSITQELISSPVSALKFVPPSHTNTQIFGSSGNLLGKMQSTTNSAANSFGQFENQYLGQNIKTVTHKKYTHSLEFTAIKNQNPNHDEAILWSAIVTSERNNEEINLTFPFLLFASSELINTSQSITKYSIPGYHTGVMEIVGVSIPKVVRSPSGKAIKIEEREKNCNAFLKFMRVDSCL
jgi:hypothetical protein